MDVSQPFQTNFEYSGFLSQLVEDQSNSNIFTYLQSFQDDSSSSPLSSPFLLQSEGVASSPQLLSSDLSSPTNSSPERFDMLEGK